MSAVRLYRQLLLACRGFQDYNIRNYSLRRCRMGFEQARGEPDAAVVQGLLSKGTAELKMLRRQSVISNMYTEETSVMETLAAGKSSS
jgi:hypothetical protein